MAINLDPIRKVHQAAHPCVQYNIMKTSSSNIAMKLSVDRKICYRFFFSVAFFFQYLQSHLPVVYGCGSYVCKRQINFVVKKKYSISFSVSLAQGPQH